MIGTSQYLVVADQSAAGVIKLATPGLRAAVVDNAPVTVSRFGVVGTAAGSTNFLLVGAHALGATTLNVDNTTTQTVLPGNSVGYRNEQISGHQHCPLRFRPPPPSPSPSLRPVSAWRRRTTHRRHPNHQLLTRHSQELPDRLAYAAGLNKLMLDTGVGTIEPGNRLYIEGNTYLVTVLPTGAVSSGEVSIIPALTAAIADDTLVTVDPLPQHRLRHDRRLG